MLHWSPVLTLVHGLLFAPAGLALATSADVRASARADHARMLAHAAKRRRAAGGEDGAYWKACAPAAVARAVALRHDAAFARLP